MLYANTIFILRSPIVASFHMNSYTILWTTPSEWWEILTLTVPGPVHHKAKVSKRNHSNKHICLPCNSIIAPRTWQPLHFNPVLVNKYTVNCAPPHLIPRYTTCVVHCEALHAVCQCIFPPVLADTPVIRPVIVKVVTSTPTATSPIGYRHHYWHG